MIELEGAHCPLSFLFVSLPLFVCLVFLSVSLSSFASGWPSCLFVSLCPRLSSFVLSLPVFAQPRLLLFALSVFLSLRLFVSLCLSLPPSFVL